MFLFCVDCGLFEVVTCPSVFRVQLHPANDLFRQNPLVSLCIVSKFQFQCIFSVEFSGKRISHFSPPITARIYVSPLSPEPPPLSGCHGVTHRPQLGGETPAPGLTSPLPGSSNQASTQQRSRHQPWTTNSRGMAHCNLQSCLFDIPPN